MKKTLLLLCALGLVAPVLADNTGAGPVTKITSGANKNNIIEDLNIGAGRTVQVYSGGSLNGAGTFDFSLGTLTLATNQVGWVKVNKTGSSLADLATRSAADLSSGTVPLARLYTTAAGYGITNGATIDSWGAKSVPAGTVLGTTDTQTLTNKDISSATNTYRAATTSVSGGVSLASTAEALAGTDTGKAIVATGLEARALLGTMARGTRDSIIFDGITTTQLGYWPLGTAGAIGTGDFTALFPLTIPSFDSWNGSTWWGIGGLFATNNGYGANGDVRIELENMNADLIFLIGPSGNNRILKLNNFRSDHAGEFGILGFTRIAGAVTATWNGVALTLTASSNGTPPSDWNSAVSFDYIRIGALASTVQAVGAFGVPILINAGLSTADILAYVNTGLLPPWCRGFTGSQVSVYTSDFSATADNFVQNIANAALQCNGNVDSIGGVNDTLQIYNSSGGALGLHVKQNTVDLAAGARYLVTFDYYAEASCGVAYLGAGYTNTNSPRTENGMTAVVEGSWQTGIATIFTPRNSVAAAISRLFISGFTSTAGTSIAGLAAGKSIYLKNITTRLLGPVFRGIIQPIPVVADAGTNRILGVLTGSPVISTEINRGVIRGRLTWAGTHEAKALIADQALIPGNALVESITISPSASTSGSGVTVGDGTTANYYVTTTALTSGTKLYATLAKRYPAGTASGVLKFYVDPDTANFTGNLDVTITYSLTY